MISYSLITSDIPVWEQCSYRNDGVLAPCRCWLKKRCVLLDWIDVELLPNVYRDCVWIISLLRFNVSSPSVEMLSLITVGSDTVQGKMYLFHSFKISLSLVCISFHCFTIFFQLHVMHFIYYGINFMICALFPAPPPFFNCISYCLPCCLKQLHSKVHRLKTVVWTLNH